MYENSYEKACEAPLCFRKFVSYTNWVVLVMVPKESHDPVSLILVSYLIAYILENPL